MPLLHLGQMSDTPVPASARIGTPTPRKFAWTNSNPDGSYYGTDKLLEDVLSPITSQINTKDTNFKIQSRSLVFQHFIDNFMNANTLTAEKTKWISDWEDAFNANPTIDLSAKISDYISKNVKKISDTDGWLGEAFVSSDGNAFLINKFKTDFTVFMDGLAASVPVYIDEAKIEKQVDDTVTNELKAFHLTMADGINGMMAIKQEAINSLEMGFMKAPYLDPSKQRPYKTYTQANAESTAIEAFKTKLHTQIAANDIAKAAFDKAISGKPVTNAAGETVENLQNILKSSGGTILDTRFINVLKSLGTLGLKRTPAEIFEKLLGPTAGSEFIKWYNLWNKLIQVAHSESLAPSSFKESVSMELTLLDGTIVIPADGKYPAIPVDTKTKRSDYRAIVKTPDLAVSSVSYIVDNFVNRYNALASATSAVGATVNEDDLIKLFGKTSMTDGDKKTLTATELESLDPSTFTGLQKALGDAIKEIEANLNGLYPSFNYDPTKVKESFDVLYTEKGTDKFITVLPRIEDDNVLNLPNIVWDAKTQVSPEDQKKVEDLFKSNDLNHQTREADRFNPVKQKVVSAIDNAVSRLHGIFGKYNSIGGDLPFQLDIIGSLKEDDDIPLANFVNVFKDLKANIDQFNSDTKDRFAVTYTIDKLTKDEAIIRYEVKDTDTKETRIITLDGKTLDNITVSFNKSLDKAQSWLDKLKDDKVDKSDFATQDQVKALGTRNPLVLTQAELDKTFPNLAKYKTAALAEGVTLKEDEVHKVIDKTGEAVYLQWFEASYIASSGVVTHRVEIQFTHNFLSAEEVAKGKDTIDKDAAAADKAVDNVGIDKDKADAIKQIVAQEQAKLKKQMDDKDISEDKLKAIVDQSNQMVSTATQAAADIKKLDILNELKGEFPGGNIPPDVMKLFNEHWDAFEDIIKNHPELLKDVEALKRILNALKDSVSVDSLLQAQKSMQTSGKIALLSLGGILGAGALVGGANAVKVATTNKKAVNARTGKIKSSKKLAIISALIGLASAAGSVGTLVYLFLVQGGL